MQNKLPDCLDTIPTRGDPESPLRWTCKSRAKLTAALSQAGWQVSSTTVMKVAFPTPFFPPPIRPRCNRTVLPVASSRANRPPTRRDKTSSAMLISTVIVFERRRAGWPKPKAFQCRGVLISIRVLSVGKASIRKPDIIVREDFRELDCTALITSLDVLGFCG